MSPASLKRSPGGDVLALVQELAQLGPKLMLDLAPKLLTLSADTARGFLEAATGLATATLRPGDEIYSSVKATDIDVYPA